MNSRLYINPICRSKIKIPSSKRTFFFQFLSLSFTRKSFIFLSLKLFPSFPFYLYPNIITEIFWEKFIKTNFRYWLSTWNILYQRNFHLTGKYNVRIAYAFFAFYSLERTMRIKGEKINELFDIRVPCILFSISFHFYRIFWSLRMRLIIQGAMQLVFENETKLGSTCSIQFLEKKMEKTVSIQKMKSTLV